MITKEPGVLPDSKIYIYEPSVFARQSLINFPFYGDYHCVEPYAINRIFLNTLHLFYIDSGEFELIYQEQRTVLTAGYLYLIDCKVPHVYRAVGELRFRWAHFNGSNSQQFYDYLFGRTAVGLDTGRHPALANDFNLLFQLLCQTPVNELQVNLAFLQLLSAMVQISEGEVATENSTIHQAFQQINDHFLDDLHLDDLARLVNMSTCHFARLFRRQYNVPPHEFLINLRINEAKKHLLITDLSIEAIAEKCGFNSASHFIRAFGQRVGITPAQFRKQKF